ncbi:hypothetical protein G9A89_020260 [Geosiphon pyriformis]|nr:hypothetical protein G9A89_020260 [Geosiphon pyriformis]
MYKGFGEKTKAEVAIKNESTGEERPEIKQFLESKNYVDEMLKNDSTTDYFTTRIHSGAVYRSRLFTMQMTQEIYG